MTSAAAQDPVDDGPRSEESVGPTDYADDRPGMEPEDEAPVYMEPAEPEPESGGEVSQPEGSASGSLTADAGATAATATGSAPATESKGDSSEEDAEAKKKKKWEVGLSGYFRAPMALGISKRPDPNDLTGEPHTQVSYGPNRTVDANYYSFAYTRLQEQDWVELFLQVKKEHVQATIGWMGYWLAAAGFRNPDAAWLPGIAYLTLDTDFDVGKLKPNIALSGGSWWPKFGRFEKYDTYTLAQYRMLGEQLKLTVPFSEDFTTTLVQGFGTGRDGSFNFGSPPPYQSQVGANLIEYVHLQFNFGEMFELGLHQNRQWTRDPNLYSQSQGEKSYTNVREAYLMSFGAEGRVTVPAAGSVWISPSFVDIKNGWALGEGGVEVVHGLSPEGLAVNYLGWTGSPSDSTGTGTLLNLGFLYENTLSNVLGKPPGGKNEVTLNIFGLMVDATLDRPQGSKITQNKITQFKYGADVEYNPWKWIGLMARWDSVNYDTHNPGYIFSAITGRLSFYSDFLSGERIYLQYSRYRYGDHMTLAGNWPWGVPLVAGSDLIQGGPYTGSRPDMDVIKFQADIRF